MSGNLQVNVDSDSWFLNTNLPYVVRDSHLAVVHQGKVGAAPVSLEEGLYSVDVVTPTGTPASAVVRVLPGETTNLQIDAQDTLTVATATPRSDLGPCRDENVISETRYLTPSWAGYASGPESLDVGEPAGQLEVLDTNQCQKRREISPASVEIEPARDLTEVPTAAFQFGGRVFEMSLPLNPAGFGPEFSTCIVSGVRERGEDQLQVSFPPARELYVTMDGLLRHHAAHSAADLLEASVEMLYSKYSDPAGAALGGLTLHNMGRLDERQQWVENLARDFSWLPDGQILCAALLMKSRDEGERIRGFRMLISATGSRPLFTDGLSLAMELLRRWPRNDLEDPEVALALEARLRWLADVSAYTQWQSINFTTANPEPRRRGSPEAEMAGAGTRKATVAHA